MVFLVEGSERECAGSQMGQALSRLNTESPRARKQSAARGQLWKWKLHATVLDVLQVHAVVDCTCLLICLIFLCRRRFGLHAMWHVRVQYGGAKHRFYRRNVQIGRNVAEQEAQLLRKVVSIACCQNNNMP